MFIFRYCSRLATFVWPPGYSMMSALSITSGSPASMHAFRYCAVVSSSLRKSAAGEFFQNCKGSLCLGICHHSTMSRSSKSIPASLPVRLFRNGANQAVRIPREFELPGTDAIMTREADAIVIRPAPPKSLLALLKTLKPLPERFPDIPELPIEPVDL